MANQHEDIVIDLIDARTNLLEFLALLCDLVETQEARELIALAYLTYYGAIDYLPSHQPDTGRARA